MITVERDHYVNIPKCLRCVDCQLGAHNLLLQAIVDSIRNGNRISGLEDDDREAILDLSSQIRRGHRLEDGIPVGSDAASAWMFEQIEFR